jgi:hypothetical protein
MVGARTPVKLLLPFLVTSYTAVKERKQKGNSCIAQPRKLTLEGCWTITTWQKAEMKYKQEESPHFQYRCDLLCVQNTKMRSLWLHLSADTKGNKIGRRTLLTLAAFQHLHGNGKQNEIQCKYANFVFTFSLFTFIHLSWSFAFSVAYVLCIEWYGQRERRATSNVEGNGRALALKYCPSVCFEKLNKIMTTESRITWPANCNSIKQEFSSLISTFDVKLFYNKFFWNESSRRILLSYLQQTK